MVKQDQQIGVIKAPWAVDANGKPVPTRYEITTEGITQIIDTDENTAYPVTADPEQHPWWWWAGTSISCAADLASFLFAGAKLIKIITKIDKLIKNNAKIMKIINKLGGIKETLNSIYNLARGFIEGKVGKYLSSTKLLLLGSLSSTALSWIGDAAGIGSCISLVKALI